MGDCVGRFVGRVYWAIVLGECTGRILVTIRHTQARLLCSEAVKPLYFILTKCTSFLAINFLQLFL